MTPTPKKKPRLTKAQQAWCALYEAETDMPPIMDEVLTGQATFEDAALASVQCWDDHASRVHRAITKSIPHV